MAGYLDIASRLAVAALVGLAIGMEREWSGHASGPQARFAGARTFLLLGLLGGLAGWLASRGFVAGAALLLAGGAALAVAAYVIGVQRTQDVDGTTETAALVVLALGTVAGLGQLAIAGGAGALVVLPALPAGPYGPLGGIRPRALWTVVLLFCALNFAGYLARRWGWESSRPAPCCSRGCWS